jgi:hypothetical protein
VDQRRNKREIKRFVEANDNETPPTSTYGNPKGNPKGKVYSHECIYKIDRKISNKQPNVISQTPKHLGQQEQENPKQAEGEK